MSDPHSMPNPTGGVEGARRITQPALHVALMEKVLAAENLRRAWKRVKVNRGAPGIDGMHIEDFAAFAREQWPTIRERLVDGSYRPQPVRRVIIPKPDGGERPLGIPTVVDRLIQQAIAQVLTPILSIRVSRHRVSASGPSVPLMEHSGRYKLISERATASPSIWTWRSSSTTSSTTS